MLQYLVLGATYAFAAAVQPGPLQAYVISQALAAGWRDAAAFGLAVLIILNLLVILRERSARFDKESEE